VNDEVYTPKISDCSRLRQIAARKQYLCQYCQVNFTRANSLSKHQKNCPMKLDATKELKKELQKSEDEVKKKEEEVKKKDEEVKYYKELIKNYSTFGAKTFNSITYIMNNYEEAPAIKEIEPKKLKHFKNINNKEIENIVSYYRNGTLVSHIIDAITIIHKKTDPTEQSIWATDSSRHNYIIKEMLENESSYWIVDKKGVKSEKYLIEPILKFLRLKILEYNTYATKIFENNNSTKTQRSIVLDTQKDGFQLVKEIDDGEISREIIRNLAKHIYYKKTPKIEEIE